MPRSRAPTAHTRPVASRDQWACVVDDERDLVGRPLVADGFFAVFDLPRDGVATYTSITSGTTNGRRLVCSRTYLLTRRLN